MRDYVHELNRLQLALARKALEHPKLLNLSPYSLAWKVDPTYYVALAPQFLAHWAAWAAMRPGVAADVLLRTGVLVSKKLNSGRKTVLPLRLLWSSGQSQARGKLVPVQLFRADVLDRALQMHGRLERPGVSLMHVHGEGETMLRVFLQGKIMMADAAFQ
ncbi:hypothetical protein [Megalodesulfovibrio paquesii]